MCGVTVTLGGWASRKTDFEMEHPYRILRRVLKVKETLAGLFKGLSKTGIQQGNS